MIKMEKVRLGVIGFGNMGSTHSKNVASGKVPKMELAAICDIAPARIEAAKELYPDTLCLIMRRICIRAVSATW